MSEAEAGRHLEIVYAGNERAIAIERFDRREAGGKLVRIHQEDVCQALGFPRPYRHPGPHRYR